MNKKAVTKVNVPQTVCKRIDQVLKDSKSVLSRTQFIESTLTEILNEIQKVDEVEMPKMIEEFRYRMGKKSKSKHQDVDKEYIRLLVEQTIQNMPILSEDISNDFNRRIRKRKND